MSQEPQHWKPRTDQARIEHLPVTNMQSYLYWFLVNSDSKQKQLFKFALARIAREHPNKDPREVLVEFFADSVYRFERHIKTIRKGELICRKEALEDLES